MGNPSFVVRCRLDQNRDLVGEKVSHIELANRFKVPVAFDGRTWLAYFNTLPYPPTKNSSYIYIPKPDHLFGSDEDVVELPPFFWVTAGSGGEGEEQISRSHYNSHLAIPQLKAADVAFGDALICPAFTPQSPEEFLTTKKAIANRFVLRTAGWVAGERVYASAKPPHLSTPEDYERGSVLLRTCRFATSEEIQRYAATTE